MEMSRRTLVRSALVLGGVAAVSREMVFGSLAEEALAAGRTTANGTYGPGAPGAKGYCKIVSRPADARVVRTDLLGELELLRPQVESDDCCRGDCLEDLDGDVTETARSDDDGSGAGSELRQHGLDGVVRREAGVGK